VSFDTQGKWCAGENNTASRGFISKGTVAALSVPPKALGPFANTVYLAGSVLPVFSFFPPLGTALSQFAENLFWIHPAAVNPENIWL